MAKAAARRFGPVAHPDPPIIDSGICVGLRRARGLPPPHGPGYRINEQTDRQRTLLMTPLISIAVKTAPQDPATC